MKISTFLCGLGIVSASLVFVGGCSSSASQTGDSSQQRTLQTTGDKSIPAPAQNLAAQQNQRKSQMDAMRAADAKAAH